MMQQYAGPLNPGDMAIRANELSPGISALLMKQMRNNAGSGIYQLPVAKQPNPDFYNSALDNVQNNIRTAARTVNSMAPEGERLAYINPQEEGILRLLGGSGEPEPITGIPSFAPPGRGSNTRHSGFTGSYSRSPSGGGGGGNKSSAFSGNVQNKSDQQKMLAEIDKAMEASKPSTAYKASQPSGGSMAVSPETGGRQAYYATDAASAEAVAKAREAAQRASAGKSYSTFAEAMGASQEQPELQTMVDLAKEGAQEKKGFFENLFSTVGKFTPFGLLTGALEDYNFKWYLENVDPDMGKKFAALSEAEQEKLKENKYLIPGYDAYWEGRRKQMMEEQAERSRGGDKSPAPVVTEEVEEEEKEEEDIIDFFDYYRRFKQPMSYEDIIKRAYQGSSGPLLESFQEAKNREEDEFKLGLDDPILFREL